MQRKNCEAFKRLNESHGFTLVELIMVLAMIFALSAIAMPTYHDFNARACDSAALTDARNLVGLSNNFLLDDTQLIFTHNAPEGPVIGDKNDSVGTYIPEIYHLSPDVSAQVQIINWDPAGVSSIWIQVSHNRGTPVAVGLNGRKTYQIWVDGITGTTWQNF